MRALQIGGPHRGREPVARVVGEIYRVLLGVERRDMTHRAEDLLFHAARVLGKSADERWLDESARVALIAEGRHSATAEDLTLLGARQTIVGEHLVAMMARDERT